jgi:hypothetical protein
MLNNQYGRDREFEKGEDARECLRPAGGDSDDSDDVTWTL